MSNTDFKVVVCAAIKNNQDEVFIARRSADKKLGGYWEFPGGKLEHGEEIEEALKREILEELKIDIQVKKLLHIKTHQYEHAAVLILFYEAQYQGGEIQLVDHDDSKWCSLSELKNEKLLPANQEVLEILCSKA